jgi:hypothetical protein
MNNRLRKASLEAWQTLPADCRYPPASEDQLRQFEATFGPIPADFRWFLGHCGGGVIGSEWVDGIEQLPGSHRKFQNERKPEGWSMSNVFVIGWDGAGNPFGIHRVSGKLLVEDHNFGGIHEMAKSFSAFLVKALGV